MKFLYIGLISIAVLFSGCATKADYAQHISRLDKAVNDAATSIDTIDKKLTKEANRLQKEQIIAKKLLLMPKKGECNKNAKKCTLAVFGKKDEKVDILNEYPRKSIIPKGQVAIGKLKEYIKGLQSIIDADTASKVITNTNVTLDSLETTLNLLTKENIEAAKRAEKITAYKAPVKNVIEWSVEKYIMFVKRNALAKATQNANEIVKGLSEFYDLDAKSLNLLEFSKSDRAFRKGKNQFKFNPINEKSIDTYVKVASDYSIALKAKHVNPLKAFEIAHEKLTKQLNNKEVTLKSVETSIKVLEKEVKLIKEFVKQFKEVSKGENS